jgi:septal ring factor EnvC (AmiA/AmiB activator)
LIESEDRLKQSEDRLTQSEDHLMQSEDHLMQSEDRLMQSEDRLKESEARLKALFSLRTPYFTQLSIKTVQMTKIHPLQDCEYYFLSLKERIKRSKTLITTYILGL